ncbi:hypothetical protein WJX72_003690 [[Myrmecia] bisecta]|uniref:Uncharacterized protein n=1 Tax=[Myrmecia] bisecta TaxID=41462 RepID=A0AAW1R5N0_9CHLO
MVAQLRCLQSLNACGCPGVTEDICQQLPLVEELNLAFVPFISDKMLQTLFRCSPRLTRLTLAKQHGNLWSYGQWSMETVTSPDIKPAKLIVNLVDC